MKEIKSYTSIWNVEKVIYSLMNYNLPFPLTFTQIAWFMGVLFFNIVFQNLPPLSMTDNVLLKYIVMPAGVTWFMSQKTFDGKRPYSFFRSAVSYYLRDKKTFAGKAIRLKGKTVVDERYTIVKSEPYTGMEEDSKGSENRWKRKIR